MEYVKKSLEQLHYQQEHLDTINKYAIDMLNKHKKPGTICLFERFEIIDSANIRVIYSLLTNEISIKKNMIINVLTDIVTFE